MANQSGADWKRTPTSCLRDGAIQTVILNVNNSLQSCSIYQTKFYFLKIFYECLQISGLQLV
jgi:hypothetical protein